MCGYLQACAHRYSTVSGLSQLVAANPELFKNCSQDYEVVYMLLLLLPPLPSVLNNVFAYRPK